MVCIDLTRYDFQKKSPLWSASHKIHPDALCVFDNIQNYYILFKFI